MNTDTKERPILFSEPMVKAILEGRKTQTRRVIKPQPERLGEVVWDFGSEETCFIGDESAREYLLYNARNPYGWAYHDGTADRLWVRETWRHYKLENRTSYRADGEEDVTPLLTWRPSIHMPRWASRITLEITDVRVERVQEISLGDIRAEGLDPLPVVNPRGDFADLWDSINLKRGYGWDQNPWVWVICFKCQP